MRHAHTESNSVHGDKGRNLTPRGVQQAREAGIALRGLGIDHALVSPAERARQTFAALGLGVPAEFLDALYYDGTDTMLQRIAEMPDEVQSLLVIGHAPTIPSLISQFSHASGTSEPGGGWFPPATYATFTFEGNWAGVVDDLDHVRLGSTTRPDAD